MRSPARLHIQHANIALDIRSHCTRRPLSFEQSWALLAELLLEQQSAEQKSGSLEPTTARAVSTVQRHHQTQEVVLVQRSLSTYASTKASLARRPDIFVVNKTRHEIDYG